jgi:hypothetical protein
MSRHHPCVQLHLRSILSPLAIASHFAILCILSCSTLSTLVTPTTSHHPSVLHTYYTNNLPLPWYFARLLQQFVVTTTHAEMLQSLTHFNYVKCNGNSKINSTPNNNRRRSRDKTCKINS